MVKGKSKSKYVGVRMTKKEADALSDIQKKSSLSKTEVLLKGLQYFSDLYGLELEDKPSLSKELQTLEHDALHYAAELKKIKKKEEAIHAMITELKDADRIIDSYHCEKNALIQILLAIQKEYNWLPKHILFWVSERLDVPMSQILNIATFYKAFSLEPRGKHFVRVCLGTACHVREGPKIMERTELALGIKAGETTKDMKFSLESVNCLGCCALGPVMVVDEEYHGNLVPSQVEEILSRYK